MLNPQFDARRTGAKRPSPAVLRHIRLDGAIYKSNPKYQDRPPKTADIDAALALAAKHQLKDGRLFGSLALASITPGAADRLHAKLKEKPGGGTRARTALMAMQYCRRAWNVARRDKPELVPLANPFTKMDITYTATHTRPVSYAELMRFVHAADAVNEWSIGTAALIAFFWLQRQVDILGRLSWNSLPAGGRS